MTVAARVRITGPLTPHAKGFAAALAARGYSDLSLANQLRVMAHLSRCLDESDLDVERIDHAVIERFLATRRRTHTHFVSPRAVAPLLRYLEEVAAIAPIERPDRDPRMEVLRDYERYLIEERALPPVRRRVYLAVAEQFLTGTPVDTLTTADVTHFVDARAAQPGFPAVLTALRSVLRFLFLSSKTPLNLVSVVPSAPCWRLVSLPQALEPRELKAVLATCDRRTRVGCRDYAVLTLLSRLGLRAGEVAALHIDDFDWRTGEIVIHGKGRVLSRLPLPIDVGEPVVAYLRHARRHTATRQVFLHCRAPYGAMSSSAIGSIARQALRAAGITRGGAHRLRHTAATLMLRHGASLTEIAQVLRHRHVDTTAIYAKVDRGALGPLARVWPADPDPEVPRAWAPSWPGGA